MHNQTLISHTHFDVMVWACSNQTTSQYTWLFAVILTNSVPKNNTKKKSTEVLTLRNSLMLKIAIIACSKLMNELVTKEQTARLHPNSGFQDDRLHSDCNQMAHSTFTFLRAP